MPTVSTNAYLGIITAALNAYGTKPSYCAHGTSATAPTVSDTALNAEVDTRVNGTTSVTMTTVTNDTWQTVGTISCGSSVTINEAGNFTALTGPTIGNHGTLATGIPVVSGDQIQWTIKTIFTNT